MSGKVILVIVAADILAAPPAFATLLWTLGETLSDMLAMALDSLPRWESGVVTEAKSTSNVVVEEWLDEFFSQWFYNSYSTLGSVNSLKLSLGLRILAPIALLSAYIAAVGFQDYCALRRERAIGHSKRCSSTLRERDDKGCYD